MRKRQQAFTLVEVAIVLTVIGLIIGGVLVGQSLIHTAELRSITSERLKIMSAINAFQDKYLALPGDIPNAYSFWSGAGVAGCASNTTTVYTGCNGNGDGILSDADEVLKEAMHLSLAGLIAGNYTGTGPPAYNAHNAIAAKYDSGYWVFSRNSLGAATNLGVPPAGGLYLSLMHFTGGAIYFMPTLTLGDAFSIDSKTDDGFANTGKMRGNNSTSCRDASASDPYSLTAAGRDTANSCILVFIIKETPD